MINNQRWLSQSFFVFFFTWGIFLPYWTGWLVQAKNLTVADASMIMAFGLVARAVATMFVFPLMSKYMSNKKIIITFTMLALCAAVFYIPATSRVSLLLITILFSLVYPTLMPAIESGASSLVQQGKVHYGKSRSYGSIGFVIAVLIISMLTGFWGEQAILWSMIIGLILLLIKQFMPTPGPLLTKPSIEDRRQKLSMKELWKVKTFPVVLIVVFLLQGAHAAYYNYGYIYLQELDVNAFYIGMIINIAVIFEILYFMKADNFLTKWRPSSLFLLAGAGSTLRWVLIFLFPNVGIFIISQALHALSFGMAHIAFIRYLTISLPKEQIPNAQGIYSGLALSLSTAILTFVGGYLYEIQPGLAFLGMIICTVPAIILILISRKNLRY
ncbi:MFS transporter, PPP family, 3-phenylpropionic acid transporter [Psychrobacillus psychrodurans]|nr:MFS transporter [Psychrobacillus psychrodurans]SFN08509.1 MFS transporter, PPP family, 3-phenylpropionic acid transporter [Psychrobacillus psychrodurans]